MHSVKLYMPPSTETFVVQWPWPLTFWRVHPCCKTHQRWNSVQYLSTYRNNETKTAFSSMSDPTMTLNPKIWSFHHHLKKHQCWKFGENVKHVSKYRFKNTRESGCTDGLSVSHRSRDAWTAWIHNVSSHYVSTGITEWIRLDKVCQTRVGHLISTSPLPQVNELLKCQKLIADFCSFKPKQKL